MLLLHSQVWFTHKAESLNISIVFAELKKITKENGKNLWTIYMHINTTVYRESDPRVEREYQRYSNRKNGAVQTELHTLKNGQATK